MITRRNFGLSTLAAGVMLSEGNVHASTPFPTKPVRLLVPYSAGGSTDIYARLVALRLSELWGQPVIVENKTGASGALAIQTMLSAAPDGHTLCVSSVALSIHSLIFSTPPYKDSDVAPVVNLVITPNVLIVGPDSKYNSARDVVEDARKNPGTLSYGTAGSGTTQHIIGEMLKLQQKLDVVAIPYKGNMPSILAVMAGQIPYAFAAVPELIPLVKAKKLKALAVMASRRSQFLPEVPTMAEAGYGDLESSLWFGVVAPARTPTEILGIINRDVNRVLENAALRSRIEDTGGTIVGGTAQAFGEQIAEDRRRSAPVIKAAGIKME